MPAQAKRVGQKKTFENIGGVSTHLLAEAIWFDEGQGWRQRPAGFLGGGGVDFLTQIKSGGKKLPDLFAPKRVRRNLAKSKKSEGGV